MNNNFDMVAMALPGKEKLCFRVRVLRLWNVYSVMEPKTLNSVDMVLIDEKVC
jgi:hypothetical protein